MEKHIDIQNKNILVKTKYYQPSVSNDVCIKKEAEDNNDCIVKRETKIINESDTTVKIEKDVTIFNDCTFTSEVQQVVNHNNHHLTVGGRVNNGEEKYQCNICNKRFNDKDNLEAHKSPHANMKFKCITCGQQFLQFKDFKSHMISHTVKDMELLENQFHQECNDVGESNCNLWNKINMLDGLKTSHSEDGVPFHIVTFEFSVEIEQPKLYECDLCGKSHLGIKSLAKHKKKYHACDICNNFYSDSKELKVHRTTHKESELRQYACKLCNKTFKTQKVLNRHKLTHLDEKPFKCDLCLKSFTTSTYLAIHRRVHTGERPFKCKSCHKTYPILSTLNQHIAKVHK